MSFSRRNSRYLLQTCRYILNWCLHFLLSYWLKNASPRKWILLLKHFKSKYIRPSSTYMFQLIAAYIWLINCINLFRSLCSYVSTNGKLLKCIYVVNQYLLILSTSLFINVEIDICTRNRRSIRCIYLSSKILNQNIFIIMPSLLKDH